MQEGENVAVGVRYSSPLLMSGAVLQPATNKLSHVWLDETRGELASLQKDC